MILAIDKDHLYFQQYVIDDEADKSSFRVKGDFIGLDKDHVYVPVDYLPHSFPDKFQVKGKLWLVEKANPKTYEKLDYNWSKDDKHHFYYYQPVDVDYSTFELINKNFVRDKDTVYLLKNFELLTSSIDPKTVRKLNERYIADKDHIYDFQEYQDQKVMDSLLAIPYNSLDNFKILDDEYLVFDDKVVFEGKEMEQVDAASFEVLNPLIYTKDKNNVYYNGKPIANADPATFQVFETIAYSKDKNHVYYGGVILEEADAETFGPSADGSFLYRDKNHTYRGQEIEQ